MIDGRLIGERLRQYGALWLGAFLGGLGLSLLATQVLHMPFTPVCDALLGAALSLLGVALLAFFGSVLASRSGPLTKAVLLGGGALLALPLLWSPVLAMQLAAGQSGAAIEYSFVYAQFRIVVSRIVFPLSQALTDNPVIENAWDSFQAVATVIGFAAAVAQLWPSLARTFSGRD